MAAKMDQFPAINSKPVLSIAKDGVILYSDEAGESLLHEWGVRVGEQLPPHIKIFVQRAISREGIEKIEVKMGKRVYFIVFHPLPEKECVNIYRFDISDRKELEGKLRESETQEKVNLKLAEIIDAKVVQSLMNDFYRLAHIPMALLDLNGNILVSTGWQEICTKFHRVNPEACKHCLESDINLSKGVAPGGYKLYKCKNNMWDVVTPIIVEGQHIGNIFSGQFLLDNEPLDYELFRSQARKYGFNEEEYIKALEKVPRLSREAVDTSMTFFMTFANMISQLSYSNIRLSQSLAERDSVVDALRESESRLRLAQVSAGAGIWDWNIATSRFEWSEELFHLFGLDPRKSDASLDVWKSVLHPEDRLIALRRVESAIKNRTSLASEYRIVLPSGEVRWINALGNLTYDSNGTPQRMSGICIDITKRKEAEEALKKTHDNLEKLVEERTTELEKAYISLKESEEGLAEAQKMAHIGNWSWDIVTGETYWSAEIYHILGLDPQKSALTHNEFLDYVHPDDRDFVDNAIKKALSEKPSGIDYRVITGSGEERKVHAESEVTFGPDNSPILAKGIIQDITERKEAEEALANIETARKKEIHHRIKNNLQVISSLLDLQADKFDNPRVIEAFRESQNRVISMALIHEELYKGEGNDTLDFSTYIRELAKNLFQTYSLSSKNICLCMDMEENVFLNMDAGVPLGIIVNELVSNSLKHAFPGKESGEIRIKLRREENRECNKEGDKATSFILIVSDNGTGIPENLNIEDVDSLGMQLINALADQLDGEVELKRDNGTEFTLKFTVIEKTNQASHPAV
ncbi:TPA: PAS domain-containing protein [Methanosarcinaceae archaeon]|nr:PAS domain-containing protein [Methanosarcinaceae archaeon]